MIVKDEAIVLKTMNYGETSKIVTAYAQNHGRISFMAKGARDGKRRFGSSLDLLNHVQAVFYKKEGRDLHFLSQCDVLTYYSRLSSDLERLAAGMSILELIKTTVHPGDDSHAMFNAAIDALNAVRDAQRNVLGVLLHFELRMLDILGFKPGLYQCARCSKVLGGGLGGTKLRTFRLSPGGIFCVTCSGQTDGSPLVSVETIELLGQLQKTTSGSAGEMAVQPSLCGEARKILWYYFRSHIEGIKPLKSEAVFCAVA